MSIVDEANAILIVPRRTTVLLSDETTHHAMVIGRVRERMVPVRMIDEDDSGIERWTEQPHRTVRVHIDGEEEPRAIEWTRLSDVRALRVTLRSMGNHERTKSREAARKMLRR